VCPQGYAEALKHFFGKPRLTVTLTSSVAGTVPHVFDNTNKMIDEIILARVAGGSAGRLRAWAMGTRLS
jgi:hypothetical protein